MWRSVCAALVLSLPAAAGAQTGLTGAAIQGTVRVGAGQPVAGATVSVDEAATGVSRSAVSGEDGRFALAALPVGMYRLRVTRAGFEPVERAGLAVGLGRTLVVDVTLLLTFADAVSVGRDVGALGRAGAVVPAVLESRTIRALPTASRDYVAFALLTPGVVAERTPPTGPTASSGLSFAGQRGRSNHVMVDGFDNDEAFTGAVAALFSQDAVREFEVLTATAPAEFGHASAGIVNTLTKGGSNELHGGAHYFLRDDSLSARQHFEEQDVFGNPIDAPKAPFHQAQWGAFLGGPLHRDRTFFFLCYERQAADASNVVTIDPDVAAALERAGFLVPLGAVPYEVRTDSALAKLEHHHGAGRSLMLRAHFSRRRDQGVEPFGGIVARSRGAEQRRDDWGVALAKTDLFGAGWLSEARLQLVRGDQVIDSLDPRCGGPCRAVDQGGPEVTISGLAVAGRQLNTPQARVNLSLQAAYALTRTLKRHSLKAGGDVDFVERDATLAQDFGGRYVFTALPAVPGFVPQAVTALEAFELGVPALYFRGYGEPSASGSSRSFSLFAQDDWRVSSRLSVSAGLRYQRYDLGLPAIRTSSPGGAMRGYSVPARGSLDPRLAVSFDPGGRGRTSLRAAFGVFHEDPLLAVATVTDVLDGQLRLLQAGLPLSAEAWRSPGNKLPEPSSPFPSLLQVAGASFRAPSSRQLSLGWTQELGAELRLTLDLLAVRGRDQIGVVDYNPLVRALGTGRRPDDVAGQPGTSASVNEFANYGESWYRGLALSLRKRMGARFEALVSYTLSQAEDEGSDMFGQANVAEDSGLGRDPEDPGGLPLGFDPGAFRGLSAADQRHRFVLSAIAELPWAFSLSGVVTAGSGRPFTALAGVDSNGNGVAANDRARRDPLDAATRVARNGERMAGLVTVDARLSRSFALGRGARLELLAEAFNLLDRVNYSEVNNVFGPGSFPSEPQLDAAGRAAYGRYVKAYPPRQLQLATRLAF